MMRRMTLIRRRRDTSPADFSAHWAGPHAEIARHYPGLAKYTQNHVTERLDAAAVDAFEIDGMAELWFPDAAAMQAATGSDVTRQLIEDEPRVFDGITGLILGEAEQDDGSGGVKVIVVGRRKLGVSFGADLTEGMTYASAAVVQDVFRRQTLWSLPTPPDTIAVGRFVDLDAARKVVAKAEWAPLAAMQTWHAYAVREVRVV